MGFSERLLDPLTKRALPFAAGFAIKHFSKSVEKRDENIVEPGDDEVPNAALAATVFATIFLFMVTYGLVRLPCGRDLEAALLTLLGSIHSSPRRYHSCSG